MVALHERGLSQFVPAVTVIQRAGSLQSHVNVTALQRQAEPGLLVCIRGTGRDGQSIGPSRLYGDEGDGPDGQAWDVEAT